MDRWDGLALVGLVMVGAGLWFVYWPLALIVPGAGLVALGVLGARNSPVRKPSAEGKRDVVE